MNNFVTVYKHASYGSSERSFEEVSRQLAADAINLTATNEWNVWTSNSLVSEHKDCDCDVYKYSKTPPKINSNLSNKNGESTSKISSTVESKAVGKKHEKILWCMSSSNIGKQENSSSSFFLLTTPSDNSRHKTRIILNDSKDTWSGIWKKLCHSLQNGELNNCNAYYKEQKEIVIYHNGHQQARIGQWIWDNVTCDYSKKTNVVLK